jgi:hypothetical protein
MESKMKSNSSRSKQKSKVMQNAITLKKGGELITRAFPIFPDRTKRLLTYCEVGLQVTGPSFTTAGTYVLSANGLYDPNITGTGHQPLGFDQMMLFYNHYAVTRAKIIVDFRAITTNYGGTVAVATRADTTALTDSQRLIEAGLVDYAYLTPSAVTSRLTKRLTRTIDICDFGGIDDVTDASEYQGNSGANPTEQSYFHVSYWNDADNTAISCSFTVLIEYEAIFMEPRPVTSS